MSYMPQSKSDTHLTPDEVWPIIYEKWGYARAVFYDPCPENSPVNGIELDWKEFNYVNPPYSKPKGAPRSLLESFVLKALVEAKKYRTSIMLLPANKTDQDWFQILWNGGFITKENTHFFDHRLKFKNNKWGATQPHFLVRIS